MAKNLMRNGGFERGNIDFWTAYDEQSFYVQNATTYKGAWAGALVANNTHMPYVMPNDYIPLAIGETAYFEAYLWADGLYTAEVSAVYYDESLYEIAEVMLKSLNPGTSYFHRVLTAITGVEGAVYVRPKLKLNRDTLGNYMVIDNVLMYKFEPEDVMEREILMIDIENHIGSGELEGYKYVVTPFREAEFKLFVPQFSGMNPTLDVTVYSEGPFDKVEHPIATFEQVTTGDTLQTIVINEGVGTTVQVRAVVAGTTIDIDFYVTAIFKR